MTLEGAPLTEVWCGSFGVGKRDAPGSSSSSSSSKRCRPKSSKAKKATKKPEASCAKGDPLCDLLKHGYSSSMNDVMDMYSTGDMYDKNAYTRKMAQAGRDAEFKAPPGSTAYTVTGFSCGGDSSADFASWDVDYDDYIKEDDEVHGDMDKGPDIDFYDEREDSGGHGTRVINNVISNVNKSKELDEDYDHETAAATFNSEIKSLSSSSSSTTPPPETNDSHKYMEMFLYVFSGVVLIFLMEQFIQLGMRMRGF